MTLLWYEMRYEYVRWSIWTGNVYEAELFAIFLPPGSDQVVELCCSGKSVGCILLTMQEVLDAWPAAPPADVRWRYIDIIDWLRRHTYTLQLEHRMNLTDNDGDY